jgi:hypothetical protein
MALAWLASAVNVPPPRAGVAWLELQAPPVPGAVAVATTAPCAAVPSKISTMTGVASLAVPENDGVVSFDGDGGALSVTTGGSVSRTNVTGGLLPGAFLIMLVCVATAVRVRLPPGNGGVSDPDVQLAPVPCAVTVAKMLPSGLVPSKISTVTGVVSLAVPENDGVVSFDGEAGACSVTVGDCVSTTKLTGSLAPTEKPNEPGCVANAVYTPSARAGLTRAEIQLPPVPWTLRLAIGVPPVLAPL